MTKDKTIPDYQTIMLPLLRLASDRREHVTASMIPTLANDFALSEDQRNHLLPSGRQRTFDNRVAWATTYLAKAGLLSRPSRGKVQITERGIGVLSENPASIDYKFLLRFPEFQEFRTASSVRVESEPTNQIETPEESLESSYLTLRASLAQELLERTKKCSPRFFEELVVDLLVAMGYGGSRRDAGEAVGQTGDGGVDGIIKEDRLGLDIVYIQAKRWENPVGRPAVQAFAGSLEGHRARKGVLITTSQFTPDAKEYVERIEKKIILIDGRQLAQFMIDFNVGVAHVTSYEIKKLDLDYFPEDTETAGAIP